MLKMLKLLRCYSILEVKIFCFLLGGIFALNNIFAQSSIKEWTIMVYFNGDNDLYSDAIDDINELERIGSTQYVNIVVQLDLPQNNGWYSPPWSDTRRFYIINDASSEITSPVVWPPSGSIEVNMGDPQELINFVEWCITNYPANHYALILWDHGDSWKYNSSIKQLKSISLDETDGGEISVAEGELEYAFQGIFNILGKKVDLIGYDACLMGSWEVGVITGDYADYMLASEETENSTGWQFDSWLLPLINNPYMSPRELCIEGVNSSIHSVGATLSCIELSYIPTLTQAIDNLSISILAMNLQDRKEMFFEVTNRVLRFGFGAYADLHHLCSILYNSTYGTRDVKNFSQNVITTLSEAIVAKASLGEYSQAGGLSIYYPLGSWEDYMVEYSEAIGARWSQQTHWDEVLCSLTGAVCAPDQYEEDDTPEDARQIVPNQEIQVRNFYPVNDKDWVFFYATRGLNYKITTAGSEADTYITLYDEDAQTIIAEDDDSGPGTSSQIEWVATRSGKFYILVEEYGTHVERNGSVGSYVLALIEAGCDIGERPECLSEGVCKGVEAECEGGEWVCKYPEGYREEEVCGDGLDNNCNGEVDEGCEKGEGCGCKIVKSYRVSYSLSNIQLIFKLLIGLIF